jgi:hypothetical protein
MWEAIQVGRVTGLLVKLTPNLITLSISRGVRISVLFSLFCGANCVFLLRYDWAGRLAGGGLSLRRTIL